MQFYLPTKVYYESDSAYKMGSHISRYGNRVLLVTVRSENKKPEQLAIIKNGLSKHVEGVIEFDDIESDPNTNEIDSATYFAKKSYVDCIVAFGGIDSFNAAKSIAILSNNSLFAIDLLRGAKDIKNPALPIVSIPIEPTMGEELAPWFTMVEGRTNTRGFFQHESLHPQAVLYDPQIIGALTSDEIARIGGALMTYSIESVLGPKSNPLTLNMVLKTIETLKNSLHQWYKNPEDEKSMTSILWTSIGTATSIVSSPMGATWAIAIALSSVTGLDLHTGLTLMLPHVMEYYLTAAPSQFVNIARSLGEDVKDISVIEAAIKAVEGIRKIFLEINLPSRLSEFEIQKNQLADVAKVAASYAMLENAPRSLNKNEIESILLAGF